MHDVTMTYILSIGLVLFCLTTEEYTLLFFSSSLQNGTVPVLLSPLLIILMFLNARFVIFKLDKKVFLGNTNHVNITILLILSGGVF